MGKSKPKMHKIGSIRNERMNFEKDEYFFSSDDVPLKARKINQEIREFIDPDILGLRKKPWNNSVLFPKNPLSDETFERKMIKVILNLFKF